MEWADFYGNQVHSLSVYAPHSALVITAESLVEQTPETDEPAGAATFLEFLSQDSSRGQTEYDFLSPSVDVPFSEPLRRFVLDGSYVLRRRCRRNTCSASLDSSAASSSMNPA